MNTGKQLQQISGERIESQFTFNEYIMDYYNNPDEYGIDTSSDYYNAIEEAYVNPRKGWELYNNSFNPSNKTKITNKEIISATYSFTINHNGQSYDVIFTSNQHDDFIESIYWIDEDTIIDENDEEFHFLCEEITPFLVHITEQPSL